MGHGFRTNGEKVGWKNDVQGREKAYAAMVWKNLPDEIINAAERLRGVQIDNRPAADLIPRFNHKNVLIYCDPPYLLDTRHGKQYKCEMSNEEHEELLDILNDHKGYVVISGYGSELYDRKLRGWRKYTKTAYSQVGSQKKEVIWMNYQPPFEQMKLSGLAEERMKYG